MYIIYVIYSNIYIYNISSDVCSSSDTLERRCVFFWKWTFWMLLWPCNYLGIIDYFPRMQHMFTSRVWTRFPGLVGIYEKQQATWMHHAPRKTMNGLLDSIQKIDILLMAEILHQLIRSLSPLFRRFHTSRVVQDFRYQQYHQDKMSCFFLLMSSPSNG